MKNMMLRQPMRNDSNERRQRVARPLDHIVARLSPSYFALVMATGIVAIDLRVLGFQLLSLTLTVISTAVFLVLAALFVLRLVRFRERIRTDARDPATTFTFLTFVAGSIVLAQQPPFASHVALFSLLGIAALVGWLIMLPTSLAITTRQKPHMRRSSARGNWLLAVVSTQSLSIGASTLALLTHARWLTDASFTLWGLACALYVLIIIPITCRLFVAIRRRDLGAFTPDFWLTMGALAITTL